MAEFIYKPSTRISTGKLDLQEVLQPYAEYARLIEKEEGIKPMCMTCGKVKTITNNHAICWDCARDRKGVSKND